MPGRLHSPLGRLSRAGLRFRDDASGSATVWSLFWLIGFFVLAGVAVDTTNAWRMKTILQTTADAAAHAGAATLIQPGIADRLLQGHPGLGILDRDDPRDVARAIAMINMPETLHGEVLRLPDVVLGRWNGESRRFEEGGFAPDAVKVTLRRADTNLNALRTFLVSLAGFGAWDIEVQSIARAYDSRRAPCPSPLLAAQARVDVQSNDIYVGLCVYADADVFVGLDEPWLSDDAIELVDRVMLSGATGIDVASLSGTVAGTTGTVVDGIAGGLAGGATGGVTDGGLGLDIDLTASDLARLIEDLRASADVVLTNETFETVTLRAGSIYYVECADGDLLELPGTLDLSGVVLLSECPVRAGQDLDLRATVLIANLDALRRIEFYLDLGLPVPSLDLAAERPCQPGDGVQILAFVDFDTAARFTLFDPALLPIGAALVGAHRNGTEVDGDRLAGAGLSAVGDVAAEAGLDGLLGLCVGTRFMLHADAVTLSQ